MATALRASRDVAADAKRAQIDVGRAGTMSLAERRTPSSLGMRPAFTLIELLVAIVIVTIGLLSLAATAGIVAAHVGDAGRLTESAHTARWILDSLGARACGEISSGAVTRGGITARWYVTGDSVAARVDLTMDSLLHRGARRDTYRLVVPCARA